MGRRDGVGGWAWGWVIESGRGHKMGITHRRHDVWRRNERLWAVMLRVTDFKNLTRRNREVRSALNEVVAEEVSTLRRHKAR